MGINLGQILGGAEFVAGLVLAPFTGGASLIISGFGVLSMTAATGIPAINPSNPGPDLSSSTTNRQGLRGASNKLGNSGKPPLVVGTHYLAPPRERQYTETSTGDDGANQYLHVAYILGYGPAAVRNIKIGDNLLASNSSGAMGALTVDGAAFIDGSGSPVVQAELRYDTTAMTYYPSRITEDQLGGGIQLRSPGGTPTKLYRMTAPGCTEIAVDIEFPNGLIKGSSSSASVEFKAEYIDPATETWSTPHAITDTTLTKTLNTTGRYTYSVSGLTAKTYQVRVYRVTADATDTTIRDICYWTALRSTIGTQAPIKPSLAAKVVRLSMRVKASDNVNGSIGNVSAEVSPKIPIYSGTGTGRASWTTVAETSNPAAIALYLLRGDATGDGVGVGPNPSPRVDANIDYPAFEALYQWVAGRNTAGKPNWCNAVFDSEATTRDMLSKVLSTCRANLIKRGNIVSVVWDAERTTPVALINQRNSDNYQGSKQFPNLPHGYRVGFINANAGWQPDVRIVLADGYIYDTDNDGVTRDWLGNPRTDGVGGYTLATKLESIERWGLTDPDEVFRECRATLAALTLRPEVHSVTQDWQALGYQYGDLVRFGHDVPEFGLLPGRVKSVTVDGSGNATAIVTDEIVTMEVGKSYSICYQRASDGRVLFAAINTVVGSNYGATFTTPIAAADIPAADDVYHYGEGTEGGTVPMIIVRLEPGADHSTTVHMQDYGAGIFTADTGTIPTFVSNITIPVAQDFAGALKLRQVAATASAQVSQAAVQAVATSTKKANAIIQAMAPTSSPSAAYRGSYAYAYPPGSPAANDTCVLYSTTAAQCGIYMYSGSAWVRQTSPTDTMLVDAYADILAASNLGYCTVSDYVGSGISIAQVFAASAAFISKLFAQYIKVQTGGSIRGGDRYDQSGAIVDGTKPGFFIAASGACKVAGIEFEGSQGGGVQWGHPYEIGSGTSVAGIGWPAISALSGNDIAFIDGTNDKLRCYRWNGSTWTVIGAELSITGVAVAAIAAISNTDIAFIDSNNQKLRRYNFDGTNWTLVGSELSIVSGNPSIAAMNTTDIAFLDTNGKLRLYRWGGTSWSLVGSELALTASTYPAIAALNGTTVAVSGPDGKLRTYQWGGSLWARVGGEYTPNPNYWPAMAGLNGTDVAFFDSTLDMLRIYRWDGSAWARISEAGFTPLAGVTYPALTAMNGTDLAFIGSGDSKLHVYSFNFSISKPWRYPFTN